jgi:hypothetical protein
MSEEASESSGEVEISDSTDIGESSEEITEDGGIDDANDNESMEESESEGAEEPVPEQPAIYKTIIDGQEVEVTLDELLGGYQKARASNKRFQEASALSKRATEERERLKEDPVQALIDAGLDMEDVKGIIYSQAQKLLDADEEENSLTEEQKENRRLREENERFKAEQEELRRAREEEQSRAEQAKLEAEIEDEFIQTLESEGIQPSPQAIIRMAQLMSLAANNNYDMSTKEAAEYYKEEQAELIESQLGGLSAEQLESLLGKEAIDQLRRHSISKVKNPAPKKDLPKGDKPKKPKPMSMEEFFRSR